MPRNQTMKIHKHIYNLPDELDLPEGYKIRPTRKKDAKELRNLINNYLSKFKIRTHFTKNDTEHWFTFNEGKIKIVLTVRCHGVFCSCR